MIFESKRSESDIIRDILSKTKYGIIKTQLMYKANMSNTQLNRYLDVLLEKHIIEEKEVNNKRKQYFLTDTGDNVLEHLNEVTRLLNEK